jgi:hypothetical protein
VRAAGRPSEKNENRRKREKEREDNGKQQQIATSDDRGYTLPYLRRLRVQSRRRARSRHVLPAVCIWQQAAAFHEDERERGSGVEGGTKVLECLSIPSL